MKAYEGIISKDEFVRELKKHQEADNFLRGTYWNGSKGCAVGCSIESISRLKKLKLKSFSDHEKYPELLGIPEWLAHIEDRVFEGVSEERSRTWPVEFAEAISPGADLEPVKSKLLCVVLRHTLQSLDSAVYDAEKFPEVHQAICKSYDAVTQMIAAQECGNAEEIKAAEWAAAEAVWSARSAAERAAAEAVWAAAEAVWSARSAAERAAESAAEPAYDYYADELLKLLREAK